MLSDDELAVTVPPSDATCAVSATQGVCAVAVTVTTPLGTSDAGTILPAYQGPIVFAPDGAFAAPMGCGCEVAQAPDEYDYANAPTISSVAPTYVSEQGGSTVTVTGTGFNLLDFEWANVGTANENDSEDFSIEGVTPTQLVLGVPGLAPTTEPDPSPFSVQTAAGLSGISSIDYAGVPSLSGLSRHVAAMAAPGSLTVTGHGLVDVSSVVFEGQGVFNFLSSTSTAITAQTDTSLTVAIPDGFAYATDVLLCSVSGCTEPDPAVDTLTLAYPGRPIVTSSSPASGPAHGQTTVTITGVLDSEVTAVDFGSTPATVVAEPELSPTGPITVLAPAGRAGVKVDVTITTVGGTIADPPQPRSATTSAATFTWVASTPAAPTHVTAAPGKRLVTLKWGAPTNDGGHAVTGYVIVGKAAGQKTVTKHVSASTRHATITSLKASVTWTFTVRAVNKLGPGLAATTAPVTPRAT